MKRYHVVDKDNPSPYERDFFEATKTRELAPGITWRFYKHWGQGYRAAEGITLYYDDRSGTVSRDGNRDITSVPIVVQARLYESAKGEISAVLSYPYGIADDPRYFWEIYQTQGDGLDDIERLHDEDEMESRIIQILGV